ncbi:MAG: hypothetical protein IK032_09235, partial [Bacteroidales bacterium]|nr:hypothetical protein [Bacteroidales bacterium]
MNITDHIVSLLKSGTTVELNGIGAFVVKTQDAYLDESSNTFYPKKQTIEFQPYSEDKGNIVQFIAKKECVGEETAAKIWKNYYDALVDKTRTQSYVLPEIGILSFNNGAFAFEPSEELNLAAESTMSQPLTDVEKYSDTAEDDPFAVFDNPEPVEEQPEIPQEESETTPSEEDSEPETETETETEPVQNPELVTETAENADAEPGDEAVESEPVPEATPVPIPLGTESNEPQKPEENTQEPATEQPVEPTAESAPLTETETNAEPTPVPNPETETETETEQSSDTPQPEPVADTESPNNEEKETQSDNIAEILDDEPYTPA